ncbi:glycerol-3-phosphate dehydrogenase [Magnetovibrio sp.]|uniref:glycerol-3-phosphate dehydrogenase n=1 Tax=Magnetovibrio sp. TaxID=2024836 RepID=UPI002F93D635
MSQERIYDLAVIGGGVNGCGIARDGAGRGLDVVLCEQGDLAQGTSSASTKLIHGGLRYLEYYEFALVRKALIEREVLLQAAPHIIHPLRFVLPHHKALRPAWLLRLGLFLYDHLGGRKILPGTEVLDLTHGAIGEPLQNTFRKGFEYSDCWVDDARLVVLNAVDAAARGADILVRNKCVSAHREANLWSIMVENTDSGQRREILARVLVNAAGPWVEDVIETMPDVHRERKHIRLVRGSHIVVPRLFEHDRAYIFQNEDGRIFFAIPYERAFTLIGTTDEDHQGSLDTVSITDEEVKYLCTAAQRYFQVAPKVEDVVWSYSGVRPLFDDGTSAAHQATRDYVLKIDGDAALHQAPLLNVFGGKITTYRKLAEAALAKLGPWLGKVGQEWTQKAPLPGGDFSVDGVNELSLAVQHKYPFIEAGWANRMVRAYGTRVWQVFGAAHSLDDLGEMFGETLTEAEVVYLIEHEWARTADDILWRRTKLGLRLDTYERSRLGAWMRTYHMRQQHTAV